MYKKQRSLMKSFHTSGYITRVYICDNLLKACNLLGIDYKLDYNGLNQDNLSSFENNVSLRLSGENVSNPSFLDLHDLWHERLHKVMPLATITNRLMRGAPIYMEAAGE